MGHPQEPANLVALFERACQAGGQTVALEQLRSGGGIRSLTWNEWLNRSRALAAGWLRSGLAPGDRVVLQLEPGIEWKIAEVSILMAGGIPVPVGSSGPAGRLWRIVGASGARFLLATWPEGVLKVLAPEGGPPAEGPLERVFYTPGHASDFEEACPDRVIEPAWKQKLCRLSELGESGRSHMELYPECFAEVAAGLTSDTPSAILYTAGTAGDPKGVVLDHGNILFKCNAVSKRLDLGPGSVQLLVLPLDSIFGLVASWTAVHRQAPTAISLGPHCMGEELRTFRPVFLAGVPETYQLLANLVTGTDGEVSGPVRRVCLWARQTLERSSGGARRRKSLRARLPAEVASGVLRRRIRKLTGGRAKHLICGGGALPEPLARLFAEAGLPILHGYGLTETSGLTHLNPPDDPRPDTVGRPFEGVEAKVAPDGEILIRGRCMFKGYWNDPAATEEVTEEQGWFRTGDLGLLEDGYLRVVGRRDDVLTTATGFRLAPMDIESALASRSEIRRAVVVADQRPFVAALLEPDADVLWRQCGRPGPAPEDWDAESDEEASELLKRAVAAVNETLPPQERVQEFRAVRGGFSEQRGEVGRSGQPIRRVVLERCASLVEQMYRTGEGPEGE